MFSLFKSSSLQPKPRIYPLCRYKPYHMAYDARDIEAALRRSAVIGSIHMGNSENGWVSIFCVVLKYLMQYSVIYQPSPALSFLGYNGSEGRKN